MSLSPTQPHDLMCQVEELNRDFVRAIEINPIHLRTQEIAVLATKAADPRQRAAVDLQLNSCLHTLRRVNRGQIGIPGREPGYFDYWIGKIRSSSQCESVRAYIRVPSFEPNELITKNWFSEFYQRISEFVRLERLTIRYIFLLRDTDLPPGTIAYLDRFKEFAQEIRIVDMKRYHLPPDKLRPSIVLFEKQRAAFTFDRADNTVLFEASEWIFKDDFDRLAKQFAFIEMASTVYFRKQKP